MTDEDLERALSKELGPPRLEENPPTSDQRYAVSTWIWSEWCRIDDQIKNVPWWHLYTRFRARKKYTQFQTALGVLHRYVPKSDS